LLWIFISVLIVGTRCFDYWCFDNCYLFWLLVPVVFIIGTCFDNWYLFWLLVPIFWLLVRVLIICTCFDCWYPLLLLLVCVLIIGTWFFIAGTWYFDYLYLILNYSYPLLWIFISLLIVGTRCFDYWCFDNWYLFWLLVPVVFIIGTCFDNWYLFWLLVPIFRLLVRVLIICTFLIVGTCCLHYWYLFLKLFLPALLNIGTCLIVVTCFLLLVRVLIIGTCIECWYSYFYY